MLQEVGIQGKLLLQPETGKKIMKEKAKLTEQKAGAAYLEK
jgi:hypothetical protein